MENAKEITDNFIPNILSKVNLIYFKNQMDFFIFSYINLELHIFQCKFIYTERIFSIMLCSVKTHLERHSKDFLLIVSIRFD